MHVPSSMTLYEWRHIQKHIPQFDKLNARHEKVHNKESFLHRDHFINHYRIHEMFVGESKNVGVDELNLN